MKRILLFCHYNKFNLLSEYIIYWLKELKPLFEKIVFISNSPIPKDKIGILKEYVNDIIERENKGFDFGAWKDAILEEGWEYLGKYDSITLMNDTCFGPLFPLEKVYEQMEEKDIDFWGMTAHNQTKKGMPGTNGPIPFHIQSYFMVFNRSVVKSDIFKSFWENVKYYKDVNRVIQEYETQLTKILSKNFKFSTYIKPLKDYKQDMTSILPDFLVEKGCPFIKIKAFTLYKNPRYLISLINKLSKYPVDLIFKHINSIFQPDISLKVDNRLVIADEYKVSIEKVPVLKVAIHIHSFYLDIFEECLKRIKENNILADLYITTDTDDKKREIIELIEKYGIKDLLKGVFVFPNRGRDILPWLKISDRLEGYDIVGHFHTKKTSLAENSIGNNWRNQVFDCMIDSFSIVSDMFYTNNNLGILIMDVPEVFLDAIFLEKLGSKNRSYLEKILERMKLKKQIDFNCIGKFPIFSYGTMFWYRPAALKPLFDLKLKDEDFPPEPIPVDGTIAHAIERLPVYIAWATGYDFRIITTKDRVLSLFDVQKIFPADRKLFKLWLRGTLKKVPILYSIVFRLYSFFKKL